MKVQGVNGCGIGEFSPSLQAVINPLPDQAAIPTGTSNICQGDLGVMFSSNGASYADSYQWEILPVNAASISSGGNDRILYLDFSEEYFGEVTLRIRGYSCDYGTWSESLTLNVNRTSIAPNVPVGETELCQGVVSSDYSVEEIPDALFYNWTLSPSQSGYIVSDGTEATVNWSSSFKGTANIVVTASNNCSSSTPSEQLLINVSPSPGMPGTIFANELACQGEDIALTTDSIHYATSYEWSVFPENSGTFSSNEMNTTTFTPSNEYFGSLYIKVKGINTCGEGYESSAQRLDVLLSPELPSVVYNDGYCSNEYFSFYLTNKNDNSITWYNDLKEVLSNNDTLKGKAINGDTYYVTTTNSNGCNSQTKEILLNVFEEVIADFSVSSTQIDVGGSVAFVNESSSNANSFVWNFGDGFTSSENSPLHNFYTAGLMNISLIALDDNNCSDTTIRTNLIEVKGETGISFTSKLLGVSIYPTNTRGIISVDTREYSRDNSIYMEVFNSIGKQEVSEHLTSGTIQEVDLTLLAPGVYIIKLHVNDIVTFNKIIKE